MNARRGTGIVAAGLALLAAPAAAGAAPAAVTLGSSLQDLNGDLAQARCGSDGFPVPCAGVQDALAGRVTRVPYRGVVVRWRVKGVGKFSIYPASYTADDTIVRYRETPPATATSADKVSVFPARIPVHAGQAIGIIMADQATLAWRDNAGADWDVWRPAPPLGPPTLASTLRDGHFEAGYSVDVEPDGDGDGYGDVSQDRCPTEASTQATCRAAFAAALSGGLDAAVARLRATNRRRLRRARAIRFGVAAVDAGEYRFVGRLSTGRHRRVLIGARSFAAAGSGTLRARLTRAGRRALHFTGRRRLRLNIRLTFVDRSGVKTSGSRTVVVGRRR